MEVDRTAALPVLRIEIEPHPGVSGDALAERVEHAIRTELLFRAEVRAVPPGSLPRFEMKARRLLRKNDDGTASDPRKS
jgi:phenylacetate-CoA ligase